jgi:hypothetical protein
MNMLARGDQQESSPSEKIKFSLESYFSYVGLAGLKQAELSLVTLFP